jgi:hypothetical protein
MVYKISQPFVPVSVEHERSFHTVYRGARPRAGRLLPAQSRSDGEAVEAADYSSKVLGANSSSMASFFFVNPCSKE